MGGRTRRRFLGTGATTMGFLTMGRTETQPNTIEITSDGGGIAVYEFTVSGTVSTTSSSHGDTADGNFGYGRVGPKRGTDAFDYSGSITGFNLAGPATVTKNGSTIDPGSYPHTPGSVTSNSFPTTSGTNTIRIEADGGGVVAYEFTVTGSLERGPEAQGDTVRGNWAYGRVGPKRGVDDFRYTGEISSFVLAGPATVYHNGEPVRAATDDDGGGRTGSMPSFFNVSVQPLAVGDQHTFLELTVIREVPTSRYEGDEKVHVRTSGEVRIKRIEPKEGLPEHAINLVIEGSGLGPIQDLFEAFQTFQQKMDESPQHITISPQAEGSVGSVNLMIWLSSDTPVSNWSDQVNIYQGYHGDKEVEPIEGTVEKLSLERTC